MTVEYLAPHCKGHYVWNTKLNVNEARTVCLCHTFFYSNIDVYYNSK